jgi:glycogen debranching enzyme
LDGTGTVNAQYYIAATASRADDRSRVLKYGRLFFVFDRLGDVAGEEGGGQGLFCDGTRYLSKLSLTLWDARPLLLSSTVAANNFLFTADIANLDLFQDESLAVPRGVLHAVRSRFLWRDSCFEKLLFVNHGLDTLDVPVRIGFDADFADLFEVRGTPRERRGKRLESQIHRNSVVLGYKGLDHVRREITIESDVRPERSSETGFEFALSLKPKEHLTLGLQFCCADAPNHSFVAYSEAVSSAQLERTELSESFPKISSSNSRFTDWIVRSISDLEMMIAGNPEHNYPYAGVPWFSTVFGRDGIITAMQTLWLNPAIARGVLEFLAASQADCTDPVADSQPGKILHEMRKSEMAELGEVPFGRYYGSIDATPLFVMLAGSYFDRTGDRPFLQTIWPNVERALNWIDQYGDIDGDGFVEYSRQSANGLVQQGWKDSNDSIFHQDGKIADPPIALCEVQGYVYAAKLAAARMMQALGEGDRSRKFEREAEDLKNNFQEKFWCDDLGIYALALDGRKKPCRVRTSNAGHCLFSGIATPDRAKRVVETLMTDDLFTGWGIRTLAHSESRYNPLSYHNGSVWPHDNSIIANGMAKIGCRKVAGRILFALLDVSAEVELRRLPELFCGLKRRTNEGPTLYPVACSPQAWSAAAPLFILQGCLGISVQAEYCRLVFDRPFLPEGISHLYIRNLRCGKAVADLVLERRGDAVLVHAERKTEELEIVTIVAS